MSTFSLNTMIWKQPASTDKRLDGIQSDSLSAGANNLVLGSDGNPYNTLLALMSQAPGLSVETVHVHDWLNFLGVSGKAISLTGSAESIEAYWSENATDSTRAATGLKATINAGVMVPRTLSLAQDQHATLAMELIMRSTDGSNAPFAVAADQTLPSADAIDEWYTLGPVTVGGTAVGNVQSASIDFGIQLTPIMGDGSLYPKELYKPVIAPTVSFTTLVADKATAFGIGGTNAVVVINMLKGAAGGRAGSGDRTITTTASRVVWEEIGVTHGGHAMLRCTAPCASDDGSNHPLTYAAA